MQVNYQQTAQIKPNETKAWFRGLLRHPTRKWTRPTLQLTEPTNCIK